MFISKRCWTNFGHFRGCSLCSCWLILPVAILILYLFHPMRWTKYTSFYYCKMCFIYYFLTCLFELHCIFTVWRFSHSSGEEWKFQYSHKVYEKILWYYNWFSSLSWFSMQPTHVKCAKKHTLHIAWLFNGVVFAVIQ